MRKIFDYIRKNIVSCRVVHVMKMMGSSSDDWIYYHLGYTRSFSHIQYRQYSTIAHLHHLQITVAHALGLSVLLVIS
jgi:hypothetical protein